MGRPAASEAAPYYFKYIDQVPGEDPVRVLRDQLGGWPRFFATISEERSTHRYAPDKWSIREVVSHVADCERLFCFRAFWFARGFESPLPSFDQNVAVKAAAPNDVQWRTHVEDFRAVRAATLTFFRGLPAAAWDRRGLASDNPFTVRALAYLAAGHAIHHNRILRERYLGASRG
jgi:hypothetical protein